MTSTDSEILGLFIGVCGLLIVLTLVGEVLSMRAGDNNPVVETFKTRVRSWWVIVILFTLALIAGKVGLLILTAFASFAALREFMTLTNKRRADHLSLALGFFVVLPLQYLFIGFGWQALFAVFIPVYVFLLLPIVSALRGNSDRFLIRVAETQWALMIAVFCVSHVPALLTLEFDGYPADRGVLLIAFLIMVVQFGDLLDFFFGRRIGKTQIIPGISAKTWEGMICGVVSASIIGGLLAWLTPFSMFGAMAMAALASTVGMFGNLVISAIKNDRGIKDWSHLIPGQGGFVDQLDSVIFAAPIFYHVTYLVWM
ncbi:phosphatidate cytidylyltransferase [Octadecabacter sp. 1_MG-2023]|uniref:phosphatidate cytidylyltransferase n=1 Tax=unclassified Octadecabacter TaxID=196158 RepID=UPI001C0902DD|nr:MULTISPECIES: phosphatidate cytidylyltransferase [unclassified Octadecabacter]MBU2994516.1 phosphatidate cytidylyltransferase [Octadecabacter sp. B2R22]MDO6734191.1 phosphatidate cytidylyltransferase [Octadecabacter sp. 1_MG-2023]